MSTHMQAPVLMEGSKKALAIAVKNAHKQPQYTGLAQRLGFPQKEIRPRRTPSLLTRLEAQSTLNFRKAQRPKLSLGHI